MDEVMEEILCSSCSHRDVCAYKDNYLNVVNSLVETFYKSNKNDRELMVFRDPLCKFYSKESRARLDSLTQKVNLTKNYKEKLLQALEDDGINPIMIGDI